MRGGGAGGRIPYRILVDSGVVLLSTLALAPAAPITALFAALFFIVVNPLLRWLVIFVYRPQFDGGGVRWPTLFEMCISCLLAGQILLATMMLLKVAIGPAICAGLQIIPTLIFRKTAINRFLRAYNDAALLQTSLLDGWDTENPMSAESREEFRRFLVDAHKAAYIPACMAGTNTDRIITAEPAMVICTETDDQNASAGDLPDFYASTKSEKHLDTSSPTSTDRRIAFANQHQYGALMRRGTRTGVSSSRQNLRQAPTNSPLDLSATHSHVSSPRSDNASPKVILSSLGSIVETKPGEKKYNFEEPTKEL